MLGLLYDVHGNLPALEAVLADAGDVDRWLLGGDYAAFGGWPAETVERLRLLEGAVWIRGNTDRWLADDSELPRDAPQIAALETARRKLGAAAALLADLREGVTLAEGTFCHASPLNDMESFGLEEHPGEDRLLAGVAAGRLVFGHTHVQFTRTRPDGIELVNPGSAGIPLDGDPRAAYAVIGPDGVQLRRVAYDHEAAAAHAGEVSGELFARRIRTASP